MLFPIQFLAPSMQRSTSLSEKNVRYRRYFIPAKRNSYHSPRRHPDCDGVLCMGLLSIQHTHSTRCPASSLCFWCVSTKVPKRRQTSLSVGPLISIRGFCREQTRNLVGNLAEAHRRNPVRMDGRPLLRVSRALSLYMDASHHFAHSILATNRPVVSSPPLSEGAHWEWESSGR